jgi:hypothetical protein
VYEVNQALTPTAMDGITMGGGEEGKEGKRVLVRFEVGITMNERMVEKHKEK